MTPRDRRLLAKDIPAYIDKLERENEQMQKRIIDLVDLIGHPSLKPRPGKTIRDEMEELTEELNRAEELNVRLLDGLRTCYTIATNEQEHYAASAIKQLLDRLTQGGV